MEKLKFMAKGQKLIRLEIKPIYSGVRNYTTVGTILHLSWHSSKRMKKFFMSL